MPTEYRAWLYTLDINELEDYARGLDLAPEDFYSAEDLAEACAEVLENS